MIARVMSVMMMTMTTMMMIRMMTVMVVVSYAALVEDRSIVTRARETEKEWAKETADQGLSLTGRKAKAKQKQPTPAGKAARERKK